MTTVGYGDTVSLLSILTGIVGDVDPRIWSRKRRNGIDKPRKNSGDRAFGEKQNVIFLILKCVQETTASLPHAAQGFLPVHPLDVFLGFLISGNLENCGILENYLRVHGHILEAAVIYDENGPRPRSLHP